MENDVKLKPCPFCGCEEVFVSKKKHIKYDGDFKDYDEYYVICPDCNARGGSSSTYNEKRGELNCIRICTDMWNTRKDKP